MKLDFMGGVLWRISGCGGCLSVSCCGFVSFCCTESRTVCLCHGLRAKAFILLISITKAVTEIRLPAPLPVHLSLSLSFRWPHSVLCCFSEDPSLQFKSYISVWKSSGLKQRRSKDEKTLTDRQQRNLAFRTVF